MNQFKYASSVEYKRGADAARTALRQSPDKAQELYYQSTEEGKVHPSPNEFTQGWRDYLVDQGAKPGDNDTLWNVVKEFLPK